MAADEADGQYAGKLITGDVKLNNLSGPISIAKGAGMTAELGVVYYLPFLALISVNLGIINLFPLPVLDGGHLLFLAIERSRADRYPSGFKTFVIALARFCWCC